MAFMMLAGGGLCAAEVAALKTPFCLDKDHPMACDGRLILNESEEYKRPARVSEDGELVLATNTDKRALRSYATAWQ